MNPKNRIRSILLTGMLAVSMVTMAQQHAYPEWAYLWDTSTIQPRHDVQKRMPGSAASFNEKESGDLFTTLDWHPADHPTMPEVVARGRKPDVRACGSCHRVEGIGAPESSSLAGLPAAYIIQQIADYKSGARQVIANRNSMNFMMAAMKAMTPEEITAAADYFSKLKPKQMISVIEADLVPKTHVSLNFYARSKEGGTEPIGLRIVEMPVDTDQHEMRDSRSRYLAYVPVGSLARGESLVKSTACVACHGPQLRGVGDIPGIAGRSPTYLTRQLHEFKIGSRAGAGAALMRPMVANLAEADLIAIAAYIGSLPP